MKKPLNVLATTLFAGTMFTSSISPAFAEEIKENDQIDEPIPAEDSDELPPLDLGIGVTQFKDVPARTDLGKAVQFLYQNGIARGITEDYFGVNENITRVDSAMIFGNYMIIDYLYPNAPKANFRDLPTRAVKVISALKYAGIMNGKSDTYFGAGLNITRGEVAIMIANSLEKQATDDPADKENPVLKPNKFTDVPERYAHAVQLLNTIGIVAGINDTKFGTNEPLKRGQLALMIHRFNKYEQGSLKPDEKVVETKGFIAFGDSNTEAKYFSYQFPEYLDKQWTDQVAEVYGEGLEEEIYNAGVSGNHTKQGLDRFKADVLDMNPSAVSIMFGINDALLLSEDKPQINKVYFKNNLVSMITQLKVQDAEVFLMTNPPVVEKTYYDLELGKGGNVKPYYANVGGLRNWINSYNDIIRQVAKEQNVEIVDVHNILVEKAGGATDAKLIESGLLDDKTGIHMTPKANDIIAAEVKAKLAE